MQLLLITAAATLALYARTTLSPLQEAMRGGLALSDNQMAVLQGLALAVPVVLITLPIGACVDRFSRVRLVLGFSMLAFLGSVLTALAVNFATLFLARCLTGVTAPATWIAASSLIGDLYAPAQRGRSTMVVAIGQFAGMAAAFALGGVLLAAFGTGSDNWRRVMLWLATPMVPIIVALLAMREPPRTEIASRNRDARAILFELRAHRRLIAPLFVGIVMLEIAAGAVFTWSAPTFSRHFGLPPDRAGEVMAVALAVSGLLGPIVGGVVADYCQRSGGPRQTIAGLGALVLLSAPAGLFAVVPGVSFAVILAVLFTTLVSAILVGGTTLFTIVVPNEIRGLCMAALTSASVLCGLGFSPLTVSLLSAAMGGPRMIGDALAVNCVSASLVGAAAFAYGRRYLHEST